MELCPDPFCRFCISVGFEYHFFSSYNNLRCHRDPANLLEKRTKDALFLINRVRYMSVTLRHTDNS